MAETRSRRRGKGRLPSGARIAVWTLTAAFGAYLVLSGIFGILAKG